ncbi:hypothetical protein Dimus_021567 [Dionaea muscipula]
MVDNDEQMEADNEEIEEIDNTSDESYGDDLDENGSLTPQQDDEAHLESPLTEEEIEELIAELLEVESKAAEAQESLEKESLEKVEREVREELAETLQGDALENAVGDEMAAFREEWESLLDDLETESSHLLEQLDGAGIDLPSVYKWIEGQTSSGCCTEAWRKRTHWVGSQVTSGVAESIADAEKHLQSLRPVRRRHGKILEEGASGYLGRQLAVEGNSEAATQSGEVDWSSFNKLVSGHTSEDAISFGSKHWASVYLASTPQQAARLGIKFPGVDEVEEIDEIDGDCSDPFMADALANERELDLSEEQRRNYRKVQEEDDATIDRKLQLHLKRRRLQKKSKQAGDGFTGEKADMLDGGGPSADVVTDMILRNGESLEPRGLKRLHCGEELNNESKESPTIILESDDEAYRVKDDCGSTDGQPVIEDIEDSDSENSDVEVDVSVSSKRRKKKIRRILEDAELGEETKKKIAIEKERQERLKSLQAQFPGKSIMTKTAACNWSLPEGAGSEVLGDASTGYIVNVVREVGEDAVRIPPSISLKLKAHQVSGIRFMWENIIQSIRKMKAGDKGLGCILAHTMGLGKTFQVIAFLYTAMRGVELGLKNALIVAPVNVLHNWKQEFIKWRPSELKPLRIFMLEDVSRERRAELLAKWKRKGGVFLIGYSSFRNLSLGKNVKDRQAAKTISSALQEGPDILICDEAHIIKNTRADATQALKQVRCQRRIALTGSPLQNNLMEYYCMVDFVREGFLGSSHEFRNRFQNPIENGQHANSTADDVRIMNQRSHILYEQLKGFVQRMDMSVAKKDLPPKTVFVIAVKLSPLQRKLYKRFLDVHGFTTGKAPGEGIRGRSFFAGYQALAQIWNHPWLLQLIKGREFARREDAVENILVDDSSSEENMDCNVVIGGEKTKSGNELLLGKNENSFLREGWWNDLLNEDNHQEVDYSGKMVLLLDLLTMSSDIGDKTLIFSQSIPTLDLIERYLSKLPRLGKKGKNWRRGKDWYRIDGKTAGSERQRLVEMFNDPKNRRVKCTLISTKAGALGINLYAANRVIIVDGSWNPTYDLQAIYRAWRYGQTKPVYAYRLMAHGTMEEKIYKRQVTKEGLAARVVDKQQIHRTMSKEEILHLFDFGDEETLDAFPELAQLDDHVTNPKVSGSVSMLRKKLSESSGSSLSDKLMETLINRHYPRWITDFHEHETLLQENEEDKLTKEEQDMAWEVYRKSMEWEEVQRINIGESKQPSLNTCAVVNGSSTTQPVIPRDLSTTQDSSRFTSVLTRLKNRMPARSCTGLSHVLTLKSQGTKFGCSTVCGQCAREISWESVNGDGKSRS